MNNFEWQQEDEDWHGSQSQPVPEPPKPKRRLSIVLVILCALSAAGLVLYRQVNEQLHQAETAVQTDILATHNLLQTAVSNGDSELFLSVLSGRLPSWTEAQIEAVSANVLYRRGLWGLEPVADSLPTLSLADLETTASLTMSADLTEAVLRFPLAYETMTAPGVYETVVLSQTAVYRQGGRNWLLSPPTAQFWGGWQTNEGQRLTLIYPDRDAELAEQLAADLEQVVQQICTEPDLPDCAEDATYTIRLDTHPESLVEAVDKRNLFGEQPYLNLPTPTLLGLPVAEADYEALFRVYAVPLATAVLADINEWECCQHAPLFQVLVDYQLSQMGIQPWPVTDDYHTRAFRESISIDDLNLLWRKHQFVSVAEGWYLYAAIDFLLNQYPELSSAQMLDKINNYSNLSLWLSHVLNQEGYPVGVSTVAVGNLNRNWWRYAYTRTLLAQEKEPPPRPLPAQDVLLLCMSDENYDDTTTMSLIRYDHQNNSGENLVSGNTFMLVNPLLDDNGLVVQTFDFSGIGQWHTEIWQFDGENTSFSADDYFSFSLGQFDPTGRYAVTFVSNNDQEMPQPNLIDLASCDETSCEAIPLSGLIFWSASGGQTLVSSVNLFENFAFLRNGRMVIVDTSQLPEVNDFWLGDSRGQLPAEGEAPLVMGRGYAPFWVDEETFGYIHFAEDGESAVVVDSVAGDALRTLVTLADVQELVPDPIRTPAILRYVITHPAQPNLLIVVGLDALGQEAFVFSYDLESDALVLQMQAPVSPYHSLGFSPNGRWLVLAGAGKHELGNVNTLYVHDLEKGQTQTYISEYADFVYAPFYDWSADGNWLLFLVDSRVLSMVAPEYEYQLVFAHEQGPCSSMAWINYE